MNTARKVISLETATIDDAALKEWVSDKTGLDLTDYNVEAVERDAGSKSTTAIFRKGTGV